MGFFDSLFGNGGRGLKLEDAELGSFKSSVVKEGKAIWKGGIKFLGQEVELFMSGDEHELNATEKTTLAGIINNEASIEPQINKELSEEYVEWRIHFNCVSISTTNSESTILFEEKESLYHFNIFFVENRSNGVSIDT